MNKSRSNFQRQYMYAQHYINSNTHKTKEHRIHQTPGHNLYIKIYIYMLSEKETAGKMDENNQKWLHKTVGNSCIVMDP